MSSTLGLGEIEAEQQHEVQGRSPGSSALGQNRNSRTLRNEPLQVDGDLGVPATLATSSSRRRDGGARGDGDAAAGGGGAVARRRACLAAAAAEGREEDGDRVERQA